MSEETLNELCRQSFFIFSPDKSRDGAGVVGWADAVAQDAAPDIAADSAPKLRTAAARHRSNAASAD